MTKPILVTGGAGFVGSHVTERLLSSGERVIALDDVSTGDLNNLAGVRYHPAFELVEGDVRDPVLLESLVTRASTVIHLAAAVGIRRVLDQWLASLQVNQHGCSAVLAAADRCGVPVMIASTSEVYGNNPADHLTESMDLWLGEPRIARWSYALSKALTEATANAYFVERGLPVTIFRLFNTVGPRQSPAYGMVIPRFVRQALRGRPLTVYGDGEQTRCFCHVSDAVEAIVGLMREPRAAGQTFNVGTTEEVSMNQLARVIICCAGSNSPVRLVPYDEVFGSGFAEIRRRVPNISKIAELIGWEPRHALAGIVADVVDEVRRGNS